MGGAGCALDAFLGVAIHLWVQAYVHKHLRFPPEFFDRLGIDPAGGRDTAPT
ncbi:hypothetical protein ACNTMW_32805 [Planosporangium sp. 12N6]|uniref:hypothetical protein n=1 Tax=Planosporangium spinosum TaxID=3402278 RepID=UPI003CEA5578